eukprot:10293338-Karenia_brevis.AAC.2
MPPQTHQARGHKEETLPKESGRPVYNLHKHSTSIPHQLGSAHHCGSTLWHQEMVLRRLSQ